MSQGRAALHNAINQSSIMQPGEYYDKKAVGLGQFPSKTAY